MQNTKTKLPNKVLWEHIYSLCHCGHVIGFSICFVNVQLDYNIEFTSCIQTDSVFKGLYYRTFSFPSWRRYACNSSATVNLYIWRWRCEWVHVSILSYTLYLIHGVLWGGRGRGFFWKLKDVKLQSRKQTNTHVFNHFRSNHSTLMWNIYHSYSLCLIERRSTYSRKPLCVPI